MSASDVREALRRSVPDPPPASYTAQSLLAAGARNQCRRHFAAAGAALAAVGVVLAGAVVVHGLPRDRGAQAAAKPVGVAGEPWYELDPTPYCNAVESTTTPEEIASNYRSFAEPHPAEAPDTIVNRMACYLLDVVPDHLPGSVFYIDPYNYTYVPVELSDGQPLAIGVHVGAPGGPLHPGSPDDPRVAVFTADVMVADADGVGSIEFRTFLADDWSPQEMTDQCRDRPTECELRAGPHGEVVGVWTVAEPDGYRAITVDVHLGQSVAQAVVTNADPSVPPWHAAATESGFRVGRSEPPLSVDELIAILASPQLALR